MTQCPECRNMIPDDSAFCDQCGKELKWCPVCKRPKRGTECPVCGNILIPGKKYLAMLEAGVSVVPQPNAENKPQQPQQPYQPQQSQQPQPFYQPQPQPLYQQPSAPNAGMQPEPTVAAGTAPSALVGGGWRLTLKPGPFGRRGGIWPELSSCQFVSGNHGTITAVPGGWMITDMGSTNGTYINGARLNPGTPAAITIGSKITIATIEFTVV